MALDKLVFILSAAFLCMVFGFGLAAFRLFPYPQLAALKDKLHPIYQRIQGKRPWYYQDPPRKPEDLRFVPSSVDADALTLVTRVARDNRVDAILINTRNEVVHRWDLDIFRHWPKPENTPADRWPKQLPGALIHGAAVLDDGDLILNYENFGLMRVDACSRPVWRLHGYITHHSVEPNDDGDLWVSGRRLHDAPVDWLPNYEPRIWEEFALKVSPEGKLLDAISIPALLLENGYRGLVYLSSIGDTPEVRGNAVHMNDVEEFPRTMKPAYFGAGDVVVSLRNLNTVFVFNSKTRKIKYMSTGAVLRQHDPDFFDGNRISVFDNNIVEKDPSRESSRIVLLSTPDGTVESKFPTPGESFYSPAQGKHQWLRNGHLLVTESRRGRAMEINGDGEVVWEYVNYVQNGWVGIVLEASRLPKTFSTEKVAGWVNHCQ